MVTEPDLCPFCGSTAKVVPHGNNAMVERPTFTVLCDNVECGCRTRWRKTGARAVKDWNKRVGGG